MSFVRSFIKAAAAFVAVLAATAGIASASTITVNKTFNPTAVNLGAASTVTVTLQNNSTATAAAITNFVDDIASMGGYATLNSGFTPTTTCAGGTPSISGTQVVMTNGSIPVAPSASTPGSCTITFQVYGAIIGNGFNTIDAANVVTSNGSPAADVTQTLTINSVNVTIASGPAQTTLIGASNPASPTITITNPAANVPLTNVAFSVASNGVNFPYVINSISNSCGATTATTFPVTVSSSSAQTYNFTGGTIPAGGTCVVTFNISENAVGTVNLSLPAGSVTDAQNATNTGAGSTQAKFAAGPTITKSFTPTTLVPGTNATVTIKIANTISGTTLTNAGVTDNLPDAPNLTVTGTPTTSACGAPSFPTSSPYDVLQMTGATIAPGATCTITATVAVGPSTPNGSVTNSIPATGFTSDQTTSSSGTANATGTVSSTGTVTTSKSFGSGSAPANTPVLVTLKFTGAGSAVTFSGGSFTDSLPQTPQVMQVYNDGGTHVPAVSGCGTATAANITATNGATSVSGTGLSIPSAGGTCTVTFYAFFPNPTQNTTGTTDTNTLLKTNVSFTSSATGTTVNPTNSPAANLTESPSLVLANYVASEQNLVNQPTTVQASITDVSGATDTNVTITLKTNPGKLQFVGASTFSFGSGCPTTPTVTEIGIEQYTVFFPTISASCTISYQVVDEGGATGTLTAQTSTYSGALTGGVAVPFTGQNSVTYSQTSIVVSKAFTPNQIQAGSTSVASVTLNVNQITGFAKTLASGVAFSDALPANVTFAAVPNVTFGSGCNADGSNAQNYSISGTTISFTGLSFQYAGSAQPCIVNFSVTSSTVGAPLNVIAAGAITSTSGATNAAKAQASLTVASGVGLTKTFENASMPIGTTNDMRLLLTNSASTSVLTGGTIADAMPSALLLQSTTPGATQAGDPPACTATISGTVGTSNVSLTGISIPALVGSTPGQCVIYVPVTTSATAGTGSVTNTIATGGLAIGGYANQNPASGTVTLTAPPPPTLSKSFSSATIAPGGTSTLTITIANTTPGAALLNGMSLTDTLPAGVTIASTPNASTTCGAGTVNAVAGSSAVALSGGSVAAAGTCAIVVTVTAASAGSYTNTIGPGALSTTQGATNSSPASATLTVAPPVTISKAFLPASISAGATSTLTVTIVNTATGAVSLSGAALTDTLPSGVIVASVPNAATTCAAGTVSALAGGSTLALSGASITAGSSCTMSVNVTSNAPNAGYVNTIAAGAFTSTQGITNSAPATATLTVTPAAGVTISKSFSQTTIAPSGVSTLTITIANVAAGAVALTGLGVTDSLPAGITIAAAPAGVTTCAGATLTANAGATSVGISGGSLGANASCTISVNVTGTTVGSYVNTIPANAVTTTQGATNGAPATATLTIANATGVTLSKAFSPTTIAPNAPSTLTITVANTGTGAINLTGIALTDTLPSGLTIYTNPSAATTCGAGTVAANAGGTTLALTNGSVGGGATCTITVSVTGATSGSYTNTIPAGAFTSTQGASNASPASATLIVGAPALNVTKTSNPQNASVTIGQTIAYTIVVTNTGSGSETNVTVTDAMTNATLVSGSVKLNGTAASDAIITSHASLGTLAAGATDTLTYQATVNAAAASGSQVTNGVTVGGDQGCTGTCNTSSQPNTVTAPTLTVNKLIDGGLKETVVPGQHVTYSIAVTNTSTVSAADTSVVDDVPAGITPIAGSVVIGGSHAGAATVAGQAVTIPLGTIAAGSTLVASFQGTVNSGARGAIVNVVQADARGMAKQLISNQVVANSVSPSIKVTKTASATVVTTGDRVNYAITVEPPSGVGYGRATISDLLPDYEVYAPGTARVNGASQEPVVRGHLLVWTEPALTSEATITYAVAIAPGAPAQSILTNTVNVSAVAPGGAPPGTGSASASVRVESMAFGNCYPITGRVYEDFNNSGHFDDPDAGVAGVTIYMDDGESVVTDAQGRYDFPCVRPGMHALRLDETTLPPGVTTFDDGNIDSEHSRRRLVHHTYDLNIIEDVNFGVKPPPQ